MSKFAALISALALIFTSLTLTVPTVASAQETSTESDAETDTESDAEINTESDTESETESDIQTDTGTNAESNDEEAETAAAAASTVLAKRGDRGGVVRELQARLNEVGFNAGVADGIFGRRTQAAVSAFQSAVGLSATGIYDSTTADKLTSYTPPTEPTDPTPPPAMSIREAQQLLSAAGFNPGPIDGLYGRKTRAGLEAFQRQVGIPVSGKVDQATAEALRNYDGSTGTDDTDSTDDTNSTDDTDSTNTSLRDGQRALANGPFDPGPIDGVYGTKTKNAIWALEKLAGISMNGQWSEADQAALNRVMSGQIGGPTTSHSRRWVEVDLSKQLVMVYDPGKNVPVLVSHISSGSGIPWSKGRYSGRSITPIGSFTIFRRISGWRQSSLGIGSLYNPLYFTNSGIAFHGSRSVPSYPASHGCVRVPMHIAEYLPSMLPNGTPVVVMR